MALNWNDMPLTVAQQNVMQALVAWNGMGTPPVTYSQAKAARAWMQDLHALVDTARVRAALAIRILQDAQIATFDQLNP